MRLPDKKYVLAGTVALVAFLEYLPSLKNGFVTWDDDIYYIANQHVHSFNIALFRWAFFSFHASNWHPLTWISHALDYLVWGLNPVGPHLTNVLLHSVNAFIVVVLILALMESAKRTRVEGGPPEFTDTHGAFVAAGVAGLLFGIHPIQAESVVWVSERKNLLCAFFFLLSILTYSRYAASEGAGGNLRRRLSDRKYVFALGFFVLALLSKPVAVSLPVILLILDWYPFKRIQSSRAFGHAIIEKIPFFALSLVSSVLTVLAQKSGGMVVSTNVIPLPTRILVAAKSLFAYLGKMAFPLNLVPFYPYPSDVSLMSLEYLSAIAAVVGISAACIVLFRKRPLWSGVWGYYVISLVPMIGIVQVGRQSMADRYAYLSCIAPFLIAGLAVAWASGKINYLRRRAHLLKFISALGIISVFVSLSYLTVRQTGIWKDGLVLWTYVVDKEPGRAPIAYHNRGLAFYEKDMLDEAIEDYTRAITLDPSYWEAFYSRGVTFEKKGLFDQAIMDYSRSIALNPGFFDAFFHRGYMFKMEGRLNEAIEDYNRAIALDPLHYEAYVNRGAVFAGMGRLDEAIADYSRAIALDPLHYEAYNNRGNVFNKKGMPDRAIADFDKSIVLNPYQYEAYFNRGVAYGRLHMLEKAVGDFSKALAIRPGDSLAYIARGYTSSLLGRNGAALDDYNKAIQLDQNNADAYGARGNLYLHEGNKELAHSDFEKARNLKESGASRQ